MVAFLPTLVNKVRNLQLLALLHLAKPSKFGLEIGLGLWVLSKWQMFWAANQRPLFSANAIQVELEPYGVSKAIKWPPQLQR